MRWSGTSLWPETMARNGRNRWRLSFQKKKDFHFLLLLRKKHEAYRQSLQSWREQKAAESFFFHFERASLPLDCFLFTPSVIQRGSSDEMEWNKAEKSRYDEETLFAWFILVLLWHLSCECGVWEIMKHLIIITFTANFSRTHENEKNCVHLNLITKENL